MANVTIDKNTCIGCGLCISLCGECFEIGDDGKAKTKKCEDCKDCDLNDIAAQCPVGAITVTP